MTDIELAEVERGIERWSCVSPDTARNLIARIRELEARLAAVRAAVDLEAK